MWFISHPPTKGQPPCRALCWQEGPASRGVGAEGVLRPGPLGGRLRAEHPAPAWPRGGPRSLGPQPEQPAPSVLSLHLWPLTSLSFQGSDPKFLWFRPTGISTSQDPRLLSFCPPAGQQCNRALDPRSPGLASGLTRSREMGQDMTPFTCHLFVSKYGSIRFFKNCC